VTPSFPPIAPVRFGCLFQIAHGRPTTSSSSPSFGASNYTYAEATLTQQVPDWIASHQRAFAFLGGVTTALVCDQLKSGVVIPCRYEPGLQRTYEEFAQHHGTVILLARPAKARDKAKVEVAVQVVERWILSASATRPSSLSPRSTGASPSCSRVLLTCADRGLEQRYVLATHRERLRSARGMCLHGTIPDAR
jgi:transposase